MFPAYIHIPQFNTLHREKFTLIRECSRCLQTFLHCLIFPSIHLTSPCLLPVLIDTKGVPDVANKLIYGLDFLTVPLVWKIQYQYIVGKGCRIFDFYTVHYCWNSVNFLQNTQKYKKCKSITHLASEVEVGNVFWEFMFWSIFLSISNYITSHYKRLFNKDIPLYIYHVQHNRMWSCLRFNFKITYSLNF